MGILFSEFSPVSNQYTSFFTPFFQSCSGILPPCSSVWFLHGAEGISENINMPVWIFSSLKVASSCSLPPFPISQTQGPQTRDLPRCVQTSHEVCSLTRWDVSHHEVYLRFTNLAISVLDNQIDCSVICPVWQHFPLLRLYSFLP